MTRMACLVAALALPFSAPAVELSLYSSNSEPQAYINIEQGNVIYLWDGRPAGYMVIEGSKAALVYGFNGKHLGWFVDGALYGADGRAFCALSSKVTTPASEPPRGLKHIVPLKSPPEPAPPEPSFQDQWGHLPCDIVLYIGRL